MSRARDTSHVWVVAGDIDQAVEDLSRDWKAERRQRWAIDSGTPATSPRDVELDERAPVAMRTALTRGRLQAERAAVAAAVPADPAPDLGSIQFERQRLRQQRLDLECGQGSWAGTPAGDAARTLRQTEGKSREAASFARMPDMGWLVRRAWRADAKEWGLQAREVRSRYDEIVGPELDRLDVGIALLDSRLDELRDNLERHRDWLTQHPEVAVRLAALDARLRLLDHDRSVQRGIDRAVGIDLNESGPRPRPPDRGIDLGF